MMPSHDPSILGDWRIVESQRTSYQRIRHLIAVDPRLTIAGAGESGQVLTTLALCGRTATTRLDVLHRHEHARTSEFQAQNWCQHCYAAIARRREKEGIS